jgi:uroporphyrinogen-III decarboxylase
MLSIDQYMKFVFPPCKKLVEKVKKEMDIIIYLHNSEISIPHLLAEAQLGVDIINVGPAANIAQARKALTGKCCFSGNPDPIEVLMRGTPNQIDKEVERILDTCAGQGGYLFNTGEMNPRDVPAENMRAMVKAVRTYSI